LAGRRPGSTRSAAEPVAVRIDRVGAEGDGIGVLPDGRSVFVPFTLPGELVSARLVAPRAGGWAATLDEVLERHPDRVAPPCPHFGVCGGCVVQHWQAAAYQAWKSGLLRTALARAAGAELSSTVDGVLAPLRSTEAGGRRRMDLAVRRTGETLVVGLHRHRGAMVVDLGTCAVLRPELVTLILPLRALLRRMTGLRAAGSVVANLTDSGADLLLRTDRPLTRSDRAALIAFARRHDLPRICWAEGDAEPEPVCVFRPPSVTFSGVTVEPPPGAFLQASAAGEAAIVAAVLAGLPDPMPPRARITELFAGCGTLTFALA
jgi:23S rRNA (uracil1939-C5)-methyltransferase